MTRGRQRHGDAVQSPLETYLRQINETPLLKAHEEKELAYRVRQGDLSARDRMVRANLRLVVNIARQHVGRSAAGRELGLQDLIAEGNLGLLRAVEAFDPTMNTRFSTYASFWIKQSIKRALINSAKTIRFPAYVVELLAKWRRAAAQLQDQLGRAPTDEEIARTLKLPRKKVNIIKKALRITSAVPPGDPAEGGLSLEEALMDNQSRAPDFKLIESDDLRQVFRLLDQLDPREATVLRLRFGLQGEEPRTLKEIGEILGLTRERVRQIEHEALRKLGERM